MADVSAFFTAYSARRDAARVEAIAVVVEGSGSTAVVRFVVVDEQGRASLAEAEGLDLYGAYEDQDDQTDATG